ncbi:hypothetical protein CANCADRAFT_146035 [Tortispora caseinolytica NRRL Y-17796]|uniref:Glutathione synthetase n=1 Tax=Tortispora caseinolytica NRRL Y-17796 TaxID=767744 RepID=A0A1E4T9H0_9ASCO|nr:hypothetical protein CANCADRAFT_146035 [Tortispora caseinolytica NRRL Y-17796]
MDAITLDLSQYALSKGIVLLDKTSAARALPAPLTTRPTKFPRAAYDAAIALQRPFNELYKDIACSTAFLDDIMNDLKTLDHFTGTLYNLYLRTARDPVQPLSLGVFRSDYMLDSNDNYIKQVEFNTISVSFAGLSTLVPSLHAYLGKKYQMHSYRSVPDNAAVQTIADGLYAAHQQLALKDSVILFITQENETNVFDQRAIESYLIEQYNVRSIRLHFSKVLECTRVDPQSSVLYVADQPVSVVYFRAGYDPKEYTSDAHWRARELLERSYAIKCPSIITQLAGTKKVQQVLATPGVLEKFVDQNTAHQLRRSFVDLYPLDTSSHGLKAREIALNDPMHYVLKPQREGGGNNIYSNDIPAFLKSIPESEWSSYILMKLIDTETHEATIVRDTKVFKGDTISELGIYGCILWNQQTSETFYNTGAGWLLRTKAADSNEGGVAAGFGSIDAPELI